MPEIALIKTSSMGDVIHNLPVASDILEHYPNASIDWVVEESFAAIPSMHPGIGSVIPVAARRWRKSPFCRNTREEFRAFRERLKRKKYDLIIDTQGLLKSALMARMAEGTRCGYDGRSAREPIASLFYDKSFHVEKNLHAVTRNRLLAASALGYRAENPLDYGIGMDVERRNHAVLLHATSRDEKLWDESNWIELGNRLGMKCFLPWGSEREKERSERIASRIPDSEVPERLSLNDAAGLIAGAAVVFGVDTGLSHLAAALSVPVIGIYCATDPGLTGILSAGQGINIGGKSGPPSVEAVFSAWSSL
ncbi:MAG TPA: lipopolysaccharide heptosyltransferase I [Burkholderiales bacterium]|nr:lipopolysaccharide heptosyltransferase I [Burkholderiales bacterium]